MSNFSDTFVSMQCPECGGSVKITNVQESFTQKTRFKYTYIGKQIKCEHCGTEFVRNQDYRIDLEVSTGGGAYVTGNINTGGGDFVGGDSTRVTIVKRG